MGEEYTVHPKHHVPRIWLIGGGLILAALIATGGWFAWSQARDRSIELASGKFTITHGLYVHLLGQAKAAGVSDTDARTALLDSVQAQNAASQIGITIDDYRSAATLAAVTDYKLSPDATPNEYQLRSKYAVGIGTFLTYAEQGGYRFATFKFPFTRYIWASLSPVKTDDQKKNAGNVTAIRADVAYAKKQAEAMRSQLEKDTLSVDQAIQAVRSDPRLSYGYSNNDSQIATVGLTGSHQLSEGVTVQYDQSLLKQLAGIKKGTMSPIEDETGPLNAGVTVPDELKVNPYTIKIGFIFTKLIDSRDPSPGIAIRYTNKLRAISGD